CEGENLAWLPVTGARDGSRAPHEQTPAAPGRERAGIRVGHGPHEVEESPCRLLPREAPIFWTPSAEIRRARLVLRDTGGRPGRESREGLTHEHARGLGEFLVQAERRIL